MFICFNKPLEIKPNTNSVEKDDSIHNFLIEAFKCVSPNSLVFGAFFHWDDYTFNKPNFINFINKIDSIRIQNKLTYRFVAGNKEESNVDNTIKTYFDKFENSYVANKSPDGMVNHNKFFVFKQFNFQNFKTNIQNMGDSFITCGQQPDEPGHALYLASANITGDDLGKNNDAIIIPITHTMYLTIREYFRDLRLHYMLTDPKYSFLHEIFHLDPEDNYEENRYKVIKSELCTIYLFPRIIYEYKNNGNSFWPLEIKRTTKDTLKEILTTIKHYTKNDCTDTCEIRIVVPGWNKNRIGLAETLTKIANHFVSNTQTNNKQVIEILSRFPPYKDADDDKIYDAGETILSKDDTINMDGAIYKELRKSGRINIRFQANHFNIHTKYILINAPFKTSDGDYKMHKWVIMGSPNYSTNALMRWEMLCKIYNVNKAYDHYLINFNEIKEKATVSDNIP